MVESKTRKAAFLREAVRSLGLSDTSVANERFEDLAQRLAETAALVTVRAVRLDRSFVELANRSLASEGRFALFCPAPMKSELRGFNHIQSVRLIDGKTSYLGLYDRAFHVEQTR
jgi:16S rRNA G527 N7-methylase RsmG